MPLASKTIGKRLLVLLVILACVVGVARWLAADEPTYAERLGWPAGSRVVIFHIDDAGMSGDSNAGVIEAIRYGTARSFSIMFPCPAVKGIVKYVKRNSDVDAGVHLTLTSEWRTYRWGPVSDAKKVPSLIDPDGFLWRDVLSVVGHAKPDEVETEIRAQLAQCRELGIEPTHLDSHMGTVFANPLFLERYVAVAIDSGIPVMVPGGHMELLLKDKPRLLAMSLRQLGRHYGEKLWAAGLPVIDDLHPGEGPAETTDERIIEFLRTVKPGVTQYIVHCTRPSASFKDITSSGPKRLAELKAMLSPEIKKVIDDEKIILTTWRELKQRRDQVEADAVANP